MVIKEIHSIFENRYSTLPDQKEPRCKLHFGTLPIQKLSLSSVQILKTFQKISFSNYQTEFFSASINAEAVLNFIICCSTFLFEAVNLLHRTETD